MKPSEQIEYVGPTEVADMVTESLVEEVSIDGMCGVY
ncbi:MAG: mycofactocin precursor MftA [Mycolicibacterium sp.]